MPTKLYIPMSQARQGELVTTRVQFGGVGLGFLVDGEVYVSAGNGFAIKGDQNFPKVLDFRRDEGRGYHNPLSFLYGDH